MCDLTNERMAELVRWCEDHLKDGIDPADYAYGLLDEDVEETRHYEIHAIHSSDGIPHTMAFKS